MGEDFGGFPWGAHTRERQESGWMSTNTVTRAKGPGLILGKCETENRSISPGQEEPPWGHRWAGRVAVTGDIILGSGRQLSPGCTVGGENENTVSWQSPQCWTRHPHTPRPLPLRFRGAEATVLEVGRVQGVWATNTKTFCYLIIKKEYRDLQYKRPKCCRLHLAFYS